MATAPIAVTRRFVIPSNVQNLAKNYGPLGALIVLVIFDIFFTRNFLSPSAINLNLIQVAPILIIAVGMTLVIATGGIDISVGSVMAICATIATLIFTGKVLGIQNQAWGTILGVLIALAVAALVGAWNGWLITRFHIQPIVATLIMLIGGRGAAQVLTSGVILEFRNPGFANFFGNGRIFGLIPSQVILGVIIVAVVASLMRVTTFGRYILAAGSNSAAARLAGVPVNRSVMLVYAISGFLAGIAGLVVISRISSTDPNLVGMGSELDAIAAVAVGGTPLTGGKASVIGTVIGAVFIQLLHYTLVSRNVSDDWTRIISGIIILGAVYLQRQRRV